jgi:hypothetical protein
MGHRARIGVSIISGVNMKMRSAKDNTGRADGERYCERVLREHGYATDLCGKLGFASPSRETLLLGPSGHSLENGSIIIMNTGTRSLPSQHFVSIRFSKRDAMLRIVTMLFHLQTLVYSQQYSDPNQLPGWIDYPACLQDSFNCLGCPSILNSLSCSTWKCACDALPQAMSAASSLVGGRCGTVFPTEVPTATSVLNAFCAQLSLTNLGPTTPTSPATSIVPQTPVGIPAYSNPTQLPGWIDYPACLTDSFNCRCCRGGRWRGGIVFCVRGNKIRCEGQDGS